MHLRKATESYTVLMGTICWEQFSLNLSECCTFSSFIIHFNVVPQNMSTVFPSAIVCLPNILNKFWRALAPRCQQVGASPMCQLCVIFKWWLRLPAPDRTSKVGPTTHGPCHLSPLCTLSAKRGCSLNRGGKGVTLEREGERGRGDGCEQEHSLGFAAGKG